LVAYHVIRLVNRFHKRIRIPDDIYEALGRPHYLYMLFKGNKAVLRTEYDPDAIRLRIVKKIYVKNNKRYEYHYIELPKIVYKIIKGLDTKFYEMILDEKEKILKLVFYNKSFFTKKHKIHV